MRKTFGGKLCQWMNERERWSKRTCDVTSYGPKVILFALRVVAMLDLESSWRKGLMIRVCRQRYLSMACVLVVMVSVKG